MDLFSLRVIVPKSKVEPEDEKNLKILVKLYRNLLGPCITFTSVKHEFSLWTAKWARVAQNKEKLPGSVLEALENCDVDMYPAIHKLLKTWLRSNMGESRLAGLALLSVHRDITLNLQDILERFAKGGKRRLDFLL